MTNFHVGQKVVCIDDSPCYGWPCPLRLRQVYTVKSVQHVFGRYKGVRGWFDTVSVHEANGLTAGGWEHQDGFAAQRFRPVVERKTDISIFQAMLEPKKARADA